MAGPILTSSYESFTNKIKGHTISSYLYQVAREQVSTGKDRDWVTDYTTGKSIRVSRIEEDGRRFASALYRLGFRRGDILLFQTLNTCDIFLVLLGVWSANGAVRGLHFLETSDDLVRDINDCGARFVVCDAFTAPKVKPAVEKADHKVHLLSFGAVEGAVQVETFFGDDGSACPPLEVDLHKDPALILSTSGSTGRPKGAAHSHFGVLSNIGGLGTVYPDSVYLNFFPNFHVGGIALAIVLLIAGSSNVTVSKLPVDEQTMLGAITKFKPDCICCTPWHFPLFARSPVFTNEVMSCVKRFLTGGAVIPPDMKNLLIKRYPSVKYVHTIYGQSEVVCCATSTTAVNVLEPNRYKEEDLPIGTSGKLLPSFQLKVVQEDTGEILGANKTGELLYTSDSVMLGYISNPQQTKEAITPDGWVLSGDIGYYDDEGFIYITGRKKDVFKVMGLHVSPAELETILLQHPAVQECVVAGLPVEVGCVAKAFVVKKEGNTATAEEIQKFVDDRVSEYKKLKGGVVFIDKIERTGTGKVSGAFLEKLLSRL